MRSGGKHQHEVVDTFDPKSGSPDRIFQVPTGAFYADQEKFYTWEMFGFFLRSRLVLELSETRSIRLSRRYHIKDFIVFPINQVEKKNKKMVCLTK